MDCVGLQYHMLASQMRRGVLGTQMPMCWQGRQPGTESPHVTHWIVLERHCLSLGQISCFCLAVQLTQALTDQLEAVAAVACITAAAFSNANEVGFDRIAGGALD